MTLPLPKLLPWRSATASCAALLLLLSLAHVVLFLFLGSQWSAWSVVSISTRLPSTESEQKRKQKRDCVFFFHIPKTGGSSTRFRFINLTEQLNWSYARWDLKSPFIFNRTNNSDYTNRFLHYGHRVPDQNRFFDIHECHLLTQLRDPLDMVISRYYFRNDNNHTVDGLEGEFHTDRGIILYRNSLVRRLAYPSHPLGQFDNIESRSTINLTMADFERAKSFLLRFDKVCFLDSPAAIEECVQSFFRQTILREDLVDVNVTFPDSVWENNGTRRQEIPKALKQEILRNNELAYRLYDWARQTFL